MGRGILVLNVAVGAMQIGGEAPLLGRQSAGVSVGAAGVVRCYCDIDAAATDAQR